MATKKVGIYHKYYGPIPTDENGNPLPKSEWPRKRIGGWCARWFGTDGKRYSKSFASKKEADFFAARKQEEVHRGWIDRLQEISLRDFCAEHEVLTKGNLAYATRASYKESIEALAEGVGWDRMLSRISMRDIEKLRSDRLSSGRAAASVNRDLRVIRRLFNLAIARGYLRKGRNPCSGIRELKVCAKQPQYIKPENFGRILCLEKDPLWRAFWVLVYTTGLRLEEATNLLWTNVDLESGQVHVARKEKSGYIQAWTPKDQEMRVVPMPEQAVGLLTAWRTISPEGCPYVFLSVQRWEHYRRQVDAGQWKVQKSLVNNVLSRFQKLCHKAGLGRYTVHDMRRSCFTNWAQQLPAHVVRQLAGHSDLKTTLRYYLSVQPDDMTKARLAQGVLLTGILKSASSSGDDSVRIGDLSNHSGDVFGPGPVANG